MHYNVFQTFTNIKISNKHNNCILSYPLLNMSFRIYFSKVHMRQNNYRYWNKSCGNKTMWQWVLTSYHRSSQIFYAINSPSVYFCDTACIMMDGLLVPIASNTPTRLSPVSKAMVNSSSGNYDTWHNIYLCNIFINQTFFYYFLAKSLSNSITYHSFISPCIFYRYFSFK